MSEVKKRKPTIKITGFNDLFGFMDPTKEPEALYDIPLDRLHEFKGHPFRVVDDAGMAELVESIRANGVLEPGIARQREDGDYELISGHRRRHAAGLAGLKDMPVFVRDYTDEEATIVMVDSNCQREEILPSEKAWAYKMKNDALKHQGKKADKFTADLMAEQTKDSAMTIKRFIALTRLIPPLMDRVDTREIRLSQAYDLSFLTKREQEDIEEIIARLGWRISMAQSKRLRKASKDKILTREEIMGILDPDGIKVRRVVLSNEFIDRYFPPEFTSDQVMDIIVDLLSEYGDRYEKA